MNFENLPWKCVLKIHHLAFKALQHANLETIAGCSPNTDLCILLAFFTPFTMCSRERPRAAQNQYSELLYGFQGKAEQKVLQNTTKKLFLCFFSSPPLSLFLLLSQSFVLPRRGILSGWFQQLKRCGGEGWVGEGEGVRKGAKAAVASIRGQT